MDIARARTLLHDRDALRANGLSDRLIEHAVATGTLQRVDHGLYVDGQVWRSEYSEGRHLLRVVAAHARSRDGWGAASHVSAAVAHGMPLYRLEPRRVHTSGTRKNGRVRASQPLVARHEVAVADDDVVVVDGIPCTSLARTVADVIRIASETSGLAMMDAALGRLAWNRRERTYDDRAHSGFIAAVLERLPAGGRGVRRARRILDLADGRAESPGESASRWSLLQIGFARPRLQVPVPGPDGTTFFLDFSLDDADAWGEFDGEGKYTDPAMRPVGVDLEQAVLDEKMREDWIRGITGRRLARWGTSHITEPAVLAQRLALFHVFPAT